MEIRVGTIGKACKSFFGTETPDEIEVIPYGHINATFRINVGGKDYILQRVNNEIFKDTKGLINNIAYVTEFLRKKIIENGGDPDRETLTLLKNDKGEYLYSDESGFYRAYIFITGAATYNSATEKGMFGESAKAFGKFQNLLADFDTSVLVEPIKDFHNTPVRFKNFADAVERDKLGRKKLCEKEVEFYLSMKGFCPIITSLLASGEMPTRVTHNDTKLNNVMLDDVTKKGVCVIDLDTVMPGSMLYDYGDSIRFGASSAAEDEKDLDKVYCVPALYEEYTAGFLSELGDKITDCELSHLHDGAIMMTLECGLRFLADYLDGDVYFRTSYEGQNLDRARTQMKLVQDMLENREKFEAIVKKCANR
ncbi:MAG: aminoglycoside phosphotransferase family protein [Clostridiales bacterium]|nr:aminoglycoside phosphotransferase family protein [Candidatus Coliplasma equi]